MASDDEEVTMALPARQLGAARTAPSQDLQERDLLMAAASGDEAAVREVFRTHATRLHRHAARILGASDPDVEDVVQQAFLAALDGASRFDGRSSLSTWLFGITTRRALDAARTRWRRNRWNRVAEAVGMGAAPQRPDDGLETRSDADVYLRKLAPELRVVFVMHDVEGYTFAEISGVTGVGISTLHGRLVAARKKLDRIVAEDGR